MKILFYLDNSLLGEDQQAPFSLTPHLYETTRGWHSLRVVGFSASGNYTQSSLDFNFTAPDSPPTAAWLYPLSNTTLLASRWPISLKLKLYQLTQIKTITITLLGSDNHLETLTTVTDPSNQQIIVSWDKPPQPGNYTLFTTITNQNGQNFDGEKINLEVR